MRGTRFNWVLPRTSESALRAQIPFKMKHLKYGAQDWTRTSMLLALAPETSVSTNSTTWAQTDGKLRQGRIESFYYK